MSTDDRRNDPVNGEPVSARESSARPVSTATRVGSAVDPREEAVGAPTAPRTTKRRAAATVERPAPSLAIKNLSGPETAPSARTEFPTPIDLPPIQLQPDPVASPELHEHSGELTEWVPTVLAPAVVEPVEDPAAVALPEVKGKQQTRLSPSGRRPRRRVRRVTRVLRHVDPWSVFKVALAFSAVLYGICLTAGVLLWNVAYTTGTIDNLQKFFESFGWSSFRFKGGQLYHNAWIAGLFGALGLTGLALLAATLFNLIADLVGGIRVTVLEEEVVERNPVASRSLLRARLASSTPEQVGTPANESDDSVEEPG